MGEIFAFLQSGDFDRYGLLALVGVLLQAIWRWGAPLVKLFLLRQIAEPGTEIEVTKSGVRMTLKKTQEGKDLVLVVNEGIEIREQINARATEELPQSGQTLLRILNSPITVMLVTCYFTFNWLFLAWAAVFGGLRCTPGGNEYCEPLLEIVKYGGPAIFIPLAVATPIYMVRMFRRMRY